MNTPTIKNTTPTPKRHPHRPRVVALLPARDELPSCWWTAAPRAFALLEVLV